MESNKKYDSWNSDFEIGVPQIDKQFINLFSLLDELLEMKDANKPISDDKLRGQLLRLEQMSEQYSGLDNSLVKTESTADTDMYVVNYQRLISRVDDFIIHYNSKSPLLLDEMIEFLRKWLMSQLFQARKVFLNN